MRRDLVQRGGRSDAQNSVLGGDSAERPKCAESDDNGGLLLAALHVREQVRTTRHHHRARAMLGQQVCRLLERARRDVVELGETQHLRHPCRRLPPAVRQLELQA